MAQIDGKPPLKVKVHLEIGFPVTFLIQAFNVDDLGRLTLTRNGINIAVFASGRWTYIELIDDAPIASE